MQVTIEALPVMPGIGFLFGAGRPFHVGSPVNVEVLPDEPPMVDVESKDELNRPIKVKRPDPHRMGRAAFEEIKADNRFRILSDPDTNTVISQAALDAAKAYAARLGSDLADRESRLAAAEVAHGELAAQNAVLKGKVEELAAQAEKLTKDLSAAQELLDAAQAAPAPKAKGKTAEGKGS